MSQTYSLLDRDRYLIVHKDTALIVKPKPEERPIPESEMKVKTKIEASTGLRILPSEKVIGKESVSSDKFCFEGKPKESYYYGVYEQNPNLTKEHFESVKSRLYNKFNYDMNRRSFITVRDNLCWANGIWDDLGRSRYYPINESRERPVEYQEAEVVEPLALPEGEKTK